MDALYTVIAAVLVMYLTNAVKAASGWITAKLPSLPAWVIRLLPLWKLLTAIAVTVLVVVATKRFAVELQHPLVVLILAQIAHEVSDAWKKRQNDATNTPD